MPSSAEASDRSGRRAHRVPVRLKLANLGEIDRAGMIKFELQLGSGEFQYAEQGIEAGPVGFLPYGGYHCVYFHDKFGVRNGCRTTTAALIRLTQPHFHAFNGFHSAVFANDPGGVG